jgi:hypothetical protein
VRLATTWYDIDQAAAALAIQLPNSAPHFGHKTVQDALHGAAERRLTGAALQGADPALTASYRQTLLDLRIFP